VPLPAARQTLNVEENQGFRAFQLSTLANPAAEGGTVVEKWPRNFAESGEISTLQVSHYKNVTADPLGTDRVCLGMHGAHFGNRWSRPSVGSSIQLFSGYSWLVHSGQIGRGVKLSNWI
jgi:hypothetical protein